MSHTYATYSRDTAGAKIVRYKRFGNYCELVVIPPPAVDPNDPTNTFSGARPVCICWPGGGNMEQANWNWAGNGLLYELTDTLGAYVVLANGTQGGNYLETAEEGDMMFSPQLQEETALANMFLRANCDNPDVVGDDFTIDPDPRYWMMYGDSAGGWRSIWGQLIPRGDFGDLIDAEAATGNTTYKYHHDHTVNHIFATSIQSNVSQFHESDAYHVMPALTGPDNLLTGLHYKVDGELAIGSTTVPLTGESHTNHILYRGNRIYIVQATNYQAVGTNTGSALAVDGDTVAIPHRCFIVYDNGGTNEYVLVTEAYAGGDGTISVYDLPSTVSDNTPISIAQEFCLTSDADYAPTTGTVTVWPETAILFSDQSVIKRILTGQEIFGSYSWAIGYIGTASDSRFWRSDHDTGRGIAIEDKLAADITPLIRSDNPRIGELNIFLYRSAGSSLQRIDTLTGDESFWIRRNMDTPAALPEHNSLHDEGDAAHFAHTFYLAAGNTDNIRAYIGDARSNPSETSDEVPWLRGTNDTYSAAAVVTKAINFFSNDARAGGSFSK